MMRNWKQIAGLGALLLSLGGLATWDEWKTKKDEKEKETKGLALSIKPDSVIGIVLHSTGDSEGGDKAPESKIDPSTIIDVTIKLNSGRWEITSPIQTLADQTTISDLLKNVTEYKTESEVGAGRDKWTAFGLTNPRRSIELETKDGKKTTFYVGINAPVGFSVYSATSDSDKVFAGSQYIATSTAKTLFDLREKKLLATSAPDVTSLRIIRHPEILSLAKTEGKWTIQSPSSMGADTAAVNNLLDDIVGLKAAEFIDSPEPALLDAVSDKRNLFKIELAGEKIATTIYVGDLKGATYAKVNDAPTIYKLHDDAKGKVSRTVNDLRDKKIFSFPSSEVKKIGVDGEIFSKVGEEWYGSTDASKFGPDGKFTGKPEDKPKAAAHVRGLIVDLEYAKAEDVFDAKSAITKNLPKTPKHHINVGLNGKDTDIGVDIWLAKDNPEMIYIKTSGSSQIYKSKRSTIASISASNTKPVGDEAVAPSLPSVPTSELSN